MSLGLSAPMSIIPYELHTLCSFSSNEPFNGEQSRSVLIGQLSRDHGLDRHVLWSISKFEFRGIIIGTKGRKTQEKPEGISSYAIL